MRSLSFKSLVFICCLLQIPLEPAPHPLTICRIGDSCVESSSSYFESCQYLGQSPKRAEHFVNHSLWFPNFGNYDRRAGEGAVLNEGWANGCLTFSMKWNTLTLMWPSLHPFEIGPRNHALRSRFSWVSFSYFWRSLMEPSSCLNQLVAIVPRSHPGCHRSSYQLFLRLHW